MIGTNLQLALREWHATMRLPLALTLLGGLSLITAIMAPFGTGDVMSFPTGLVYWSVIVFAAYSAGHLVDALLRTSLPQETGTLLRVLLNGLLTGICASLIVFLTNLVILGYVPSGQDSLQLILTIIAVSLIISYLTHVTFAALHPSAEPNTHSAPPLLDRLDLDKRGPLIALSVEDHYVRVYTSKGDALLLMRLSDAIREVGETEGAQVHRSHWVAFDQITSLERDGARVILTLTNDIEIPVSRANVPKLKEAGLLPR